MKKEIIRFKATVTVFIITLLFLNMMSLNGQNVRFGVFANPVISWFKSDTRETMTKGARAGFNFGFTINKYFGDNYALSSGINLLNAGGQTLNTVPVEMKFKNLQALVAAGDAVIYKIQYLSIPVGLRFKTNQIGYISFFTDLGLDPKVVLSSKTDIPSLDISDENAIDEIRLFNLSYHITGGIEYSLGGNTALVAGLGFDNNFFDITKENGSQPVDKIGHKIIKFNLGLNF